MSTTVLGMPLTDWMNYMTYIVTAAAAAAAVFPQAKEGSIWSYMRKLIDFLAMNFGNAANHSK